MSNELDNPLLDDDDLEAAPEKRYRAVNGLAVASLVFGLLSVLTVINWMFAAAPALGIALGYLAFRRFRRNPEEQTGMAFAKAGIALSTLLWVGGYGYLIYDYFTAAPPGYKYVSYKTLLSNPKDPEEWVPPAAEDLDKTKVFIRGFMRPTRQQMGLRQFVLVDDPGACSFCAPTPRTTQLILVKLKGSLRAEYTTHLIGVGGELTLHKPGEDGMGGLFYKIEADVLK